MLRRDLLRKKLIWPPMFSAFKENAKAVMFTPASLLPPGYHHTRQDYELGLFS
jgi:hypothetical protein